MLGPSLESQCHITLRMDEHLRVQWCYDNERHGQSWTTTPGQVTIVYRDRPRLSQLIRSFHDNKQYQLSPAKRQRDCLDTKQTREIGEYGRVMDFHVNCYLNSCRQVSYETK